MTLKWSEEQIKFLADNYPKFGQGYCASKLDIAATVVKSKARYLGLRLLPKLERLCKSCSINTQTISRRSKLCDVCYIAAKRVEWKKYHIFKPKRPRSDELGRISKRFATTVRSRNRILYGTTNSDITEHDIRNLYNMQDGKCYYTNRPMKLTPSTARDPDLMSVDRIDSEKAYTMQNIVLSTWLVNKVKNDLNFEDFLELCKDVARNHP